MLRSSKARSILETFAGIITLVREVILYNIFILSKSHSIDAVIQKIPFIEIACFIWGTSISYDSKRTMYKKEFACIVILVNPSSGNTAHTVKVFLV